MSKNKKVISKITNMVIVLAVIGLVIAKLYDIGIHRPSLAYRQLSPQTIQWLNAFNQADPESIIKAAPIGPFEWDNREDIGQKRKMGKWGKEEDANAIVYYRKDRDAQGQIRARRVIDCVENIILELPAYLSTYHYPTDLNGRKMAIYLPDKDDDYSILVNKLSDNGLLGGSKYGCSVISIGPLGCQCRGIIIHPSAFKSNNADGDPEFIRVLRRELAYYTYMAGLDYNRPSHRQAWFIQGISEHFALEGNRLPSFTPEFIQRVEQECALDAEFPAGNKMSQLGGTSFIQFYEQAFGQLALADLIEATYTMPVDSALCRNNDLTTLKQQWIEYLRAEQVQENALTDAQF